MEIRTFNKENESDVNDGVVPSSIVFCDKLENLDTIVDFYNDENHIFYQVQLARIIRSLLRVESDEYLLITDSKRI